MTAPPPGPYPPPPQPYGYPPAAAARPGIVTAAAVLAFISGGLGLIGNLIAFSWLSLIGGSYAILIILGLAIAAVLIWGGVQALNGKDGRILVIVAAGAIVLNLIQMIIYFAATSLIGMVIPILILAFMLNPQSKAWIASRGGQTF